MYQTYKDIDVEWLKANCQTIHFFGLGFIQIKINQEYRLHFYSPKLEAFVESPHNHRYDFSSKVLKGQITNKIYKIIKGQSHLVLADSCQEGFKAIQSPKEVAFELSSTNTYQEGQSYRMKHRLFHTVEAKGCITLLRRSDYKKDLADVSYEKNTEKLCPFSKNISEKELWVLVEEMLA